jgi:hypothetical protein
MRWTKSLAVTGAVTALCLILNVPVASAATEVTKKACKAANGSFHQDRGTKICVTTFSQTVSTTETIDFYLDGRDFPLYTGKQRRDTTTTTRTRQSQHGNGPVHVSTRTTATSTSTPTECWYWDYDRISEYYFLVQVPIAECQERGVYS